MRSLHSLTKTPVLSLLGLLLALFIQATLFHQSALASPVSATPLDSRSLTKRYEGTPSGKVGDGGPDASDYPSDEDIRNSYIAPTGPSVFFSQIGDSTTAFNFAQSKGGVIFRSTFPPKYTNENKRSKQWHQDFADRFSGVFAEKASGDVYLVSTWNYAIDDCRVWTRIEYPSLKANPDVTSIILVDYTNWANQKVIWTPDGLIGLRSELTPRSDSNNNLLKKRDGGVCLDWDGYGDDPADPDADPTVDIGYYPGWCGVHVKQYQKNEKDVNPNPNYRFDILIKDDQGETIGELDFADAPGGQGVDVDSKLPNVLVVTAGDTDSDAVYFSYGDQTWGSNDQQHQCNFGSYDSGSRQGDCGFTC